jgi:hypothetical protein
MPLLNRVSHQAPWPAVVVSDGRSGTASRIAARHRIPRWSRRSPPHPALIAPLATASRADRAARHRMPA